MAGWGGGGGVGLTDGAGSACQRSSVVRVGPSPGLIVLLCLPGVHFLFFFCRGNAPHPSMRSPTPPVFRSTASMLVQLGVPAAAAHRGPPPEAVDPPPPATATGHPSSPHGGGEADADHPRYHRSPARHLHAQQARGSGNEEPPKQQPRGVHPLPPTPGSYAAAVSGQGG